MGGEEYLSTNYVGQPKSNLQQKKLTHIPLQTLKGLNVSTKTVGSGVSGAHNTSILKVSQEDNELETISKINKQQNFYEKILVPKSVEIFS